MNLLTPLNRWLQPGNHLDHDTRARLAAWRALPSPGPDSSFNATRCVVLDTETSGLDTVTDRLLAVGAVGLAGLRIRLSDNFDSVLRQSTPSERKNILIHGIGEAAQREGEAHGPALLRLLEFVGKAPLIAFHAPFDQAFIQRAFGEQLGKPPRFQWFDLAAILPALFECKPNLSLDDWLYRFGIDVPARHSALGDAFATAQLAQIALRRAQVAGIETMGGLSRLARDARWLHR